MDSTEDKIVRFSDEIETETFCVDRSQATKSKLWYSQMDIDIFHAWADRCVQKLRSAMQRTQLRKQSHDGQEQKPGKVAPLDAGDIIGLERHSTPDLSNEYRLRHRAVVKAVLDEQRRQRIHRVVSVERMVRAAQENSRWAMDKARSAGLYLERDMDDGLTSDDESYLAACIRDVHLSCQIHQASLRQGPPPHPSKAMVVRRSATKRIRTI